MILAPPAGRGAVSARLAPSLPRELLAALGSLLVMALLSCALAGCADHRNLSPDEAEIVAWYIEDVAHGTPRRPEELQLVEGSERVGHISEWLMGSSIRGQREPPAMLQSRLDRLHLLANLMQQGFAVAVPDSGLLAPRPGLDLADREVAEPVIDAENHDRRAIDAIVLSMADAPAAIGQRYLEIVAHARRELDARAGAQIWMPPAPAAGQDPSAR